jgi:DNA-binding transcriptional MerR regulator
MTISELADFFGVRPSAPSALRFYERVGILCPAGRISGRRRYDKTAEERLAFILSGRESGFTLKEIKRIISAASRGDSPRGLWRGASATKRIRLQREIKRLRTMQRSFERKAACRCRTLRDCERLLAGERRSSSARQKTTMGVE